MSHVEEHLKSLGYTLPAAPAAAGSYLPYRISGNQLFLSGVLCMKEGRLTHAGKVGGPLTVEDGYEAASVCALNVLANIKAALDSLDRVSQFVFVAGYVNGVEGFARSPEIINGASNLFVEVFGDKGKHARAAVTVAGLPLDAAVELQVVVEFV